MMLIEGRSARYFFFRCGCTLWVNNVIFGCGQRVEGSHFFEKYLHCAWRCNNFCVQISPCSGPLSGSWKKGGYLFVEIGPPSVFTKKKGEKKNSQKEAPGAKNGIFEKCSVPRWDALGQENAKKGSLRRGVFCDAVGERIFYEKTMNK